MVRLFSRWVAVLCAVAALFLAACGSAVHDLPAVAAKNSVSSSSNSTPAASRSRRPGTAPPTRAAASRSPVCKTSHLRITMTGTGAAAGTAGGRIAFTNLALSPCRLRGWPALVLITSRGKASIATDRITTIFGPNLRTVPLVILRHDATAEAVFTGGDNPLQPREGLCPSYRFLRVTPPGDSRSATLSAWIRYLNHYMPACTGIWVSEVVSYAALHQGSQDKR
jgi:Protein of unknown function (DUF4232)